MQDSLARELEAEIEELDVAVQQPYQQPYQEPAPAIEPIPQAVPISKGLSKFEVILIAALGIIIFGLILMNVSTSLEMTNASRSMQDVNSSIAQAQIEIENLNQQSHELSRYDRIYEIAKKNGLELHEENIRNIAPVE